MKLEFRFLILTASILLGCFVGLAYFNHLDFFSSGNSRLDENGNPYHSSFDSENTAEKSLKDEIRQQLASTRTLYEFTATTDQQTAETPAQPDVQESSVQESSAQEPSAPSLLASVEVDPEKAGDALEEVTANSPKSTGSRAGLDETSKTPADKLAQKTGSTQEDLESKPKALISVRDYSQATPILDVNPVEDLVEFQVQGAAEAQNTLSQELLAQTQTPAPAQIPASSQILAPVQTPAPAQISAPAPIPAWAQGNIPAEAPVLAQGTAPIQTSVPIQSPAPIQTTAPFETPELLQTSALVQTSAPAGSPTQEPLLQASGDGLEQAPVNQAVGSLAAVPDATAEPLQPSEIPDDLDENPLAAIMGLTSTENAGENESSNGAVENPGAAVETPAEYSAELSENPSVKTPEETAAASLVPTPMESSAENPVGSLVETPTGSPTGSPAISSTEISVGSPVETSTGSLAGSPAVSSTETPVGALSGSPAAPSVPNPAGTPAETSIAIPGETTPKTPSETSNQIVGNSFSHQPTRIKKPYRNPTENQSGKETGAPIQKEEYSLDIYRVNLRKALASFQIETGLKVVASLDVQGTVSCKSKNADPEILLSSLLADTQFKFVRSGNFVYIAPANQLTNLPTPLEKTETQIFTPKYISLDELELVFKSNLSQFGTCEVVHDPSGQIGLSVTDWVLSLDQLEKIQQIVDVPAPEDQINAFVFQRELDGTFKALELLEIAESQGLVLQRVTPMETGTKDEKKAFFPGSKNEKSSGIQAYTISYRADSFMASVRQQLKTQPAPMPGQTTAPLELNRPMTFDFNLNVQDRLVPYQITVTYRQDSQSAGGILADVVCEPRTELGTKAKANDFHFTLAIPSQGRNSLILQLDLGEFPVENAGARKDVSYAMRGNRMKKEVVVVLCPFQNVPKIPRNGLSAQAVREIIRQQEVLARKFYGSLDQGERENSKRCFAIAQRLRMSLGETGN